MATGSKWWACDCCGKGRAGPYYDDAQPYPYLSGDYARQAGPCDCCGGDSVVVIIGSARDNYNMNSNIPPPGNQCPACNAASPYWSQLVGKSIAADLCVEQCNDLGVVKRYVGCSAFPVSYYSPFARFGDPTQRCNLEGTIYIKVDVRCGRSHITSKRIVGIIMTYGYLPGPKPPCNVSGGDCAAFMLQFPNGTCSGVPLEPNDCEDDETYTPPLNIGGTRCARGCSPTIAFEATTPAGVTGITVVL